MMYVIKDDKIFKDSSSLYTRLVIACNEINKSPSRDCDVGSGFYPRFQTSNNNVYKEKDLKVMIENMNEILSKYRLLMLNIDNDSNCDCPTKKRFDLYRSLVHEFDKPKINVTLQKNVYFKGISTIRINHLISLAALVGVIPIEYYIFTPIHSKGGVNNFLKEELGFKDTNKNQTQTSIQKWNVNIIKEIHHTYNNCNFTPNMLENMLCIISRRLTKFDIYYQLPYINSDTKTVSSKRKMQLCFKINGHKTSHWSLDVFNGNDIHTMFSHKCNILNRIKYSRTETGLLNDSKHFVDNDWIEIVLKTNE